MNSFEMRAIGNLARNPELISKEGSVCIRLCVVGHDYRGRDGDGEAREQVTMIWFSAFGALGEALARNCRSGDQLILDACVQSKSSTAEEASVPYDFIVTGFRFGALGRSTRGVPIASDES